MKKITAAFLALCLFCLIFAGCSVKNKNNNNGTALATADTVFTMSGPGGSVSLGEEEARKLLGAFSQKTLGLEKPLDSYNLKLSATRVFGNDACLVQAFDGESTTPAAIFAIQGYTCYLYNKSADTYLLLTSEGAVPVTTGASTESASFTYDADNNKKLHKMFDGYSRDQLGLPKEVAEYVLMAVGTTTKAADKKTVYIVRFYEKNGTSTNYTVAFSSEGGKYHFNIETKKYEKLK